MNKKNISKILMVSVLTLLLTGCGGNAVTKAVDKTLKANNFDSSVTTTISYNGDDAVSDKITIKNDTKSNTLESTYVVEDEYNKTTFVTYYLMKTNENYVTANSTVIKEMDEESSMGTEDEEAAKYQKNNYKYIYSLETFKELFKDATVSKSSDNTYKVTVKANDFYKVFDGVLYLSNSDYVRLDSNAKTNIDFTVTLNGKYISKIEANLTNYMKEATKYDEESSLITTYLFTYNVSNVGSSSSVSLPSDATTNYEDYAKNDAETSAIIYISFLNTLELEDGNYTAGETYGNITPDSVNLIIKDEVVSGGTITINGYTFTYTVTDDVAELK